MQPVALDDGLPFATGVLHLIDQGRGSTRVLGRLDTKTGRHDPPHPAPPEYVTVDDVQRLVRSGWRGGSPFELRGEDPRIRDIRGGVVLLR